MTKPMNTLSRKTARRKVALKNLKNKTYKPQTERDVIEMEILGKRISEAPTGKVFTKKPRSKDSKRITTEVF